MDACFVADQPGAVVCPRAQLINDLENPVSTLCTGFSERFRQDKHRLLEPCSKARCAALFCFWSEPDFLPPNPQTQARFIGEVIKLITGTAFIVIGLVALVVAAIRRRTGGKIGRAHV